jgi:Ras-related protein Rab-11A
MNQEYDYLYKIVVIGESEVGKSSLITRFTKDKFSVKLDPTIGVEVVNKFIELNDKKIKLQLWDTSGQDKYRAITRAYYKNTMGILLVYDISKQESFKNLDRWQKELQEYTADNVAVTLVGTKNDLTNSREVSTTQGQELAQQHGYSFIETSATSNVDTLFYNLSKDILARQIQPTPSTKEYDYLYKIVFIGDSKVGKSNLSSRFTNNKFDNKPTIGVDFASKLIQINDTKIKVLLWDTSGLERFQILTKAYFRGAIKALLVYDVTDPTSFKNLHQWQQELEKYADDNLTITLIGNKTDLTHLRQVSTIQGQEYAQQHGYNFIEISITSDTESIFHDLIKNIFDQETHPATRSATQPVTRSETDVVTQSETDVVTQSETDVVTRSETDVVTQSETDVVTQSETDVVTQPVAGVKENNKIGGGLEVIFYVIFICYFYFCCVYN